jgi:hypothetical protein
MLYRVHLAWAGFDLTTLVVIGTDCIYSYKSNYHDHDGTRYINARWIIHVKDECPVDGGLHSWQMLQEREDRIGVRVVVFNATIINISFICHNLFYLSATLKQCFTEFAVSGNVFHHAYMSVRGRIPTCDLIGRLFLGSGLQRMFWLSKIRKLFRVRHDTLLRLSRY